MEFMNVVRERRSTRVFTDQPVEEEKLQQILEAANLAPSAGDLQGYEIYLARSLEVRQALARAAYGQDFIQQAPLALVFCAHPALSQARYGPRGVQLYCVQDATIACTVAMLAARDLGLGSVWVGAFDDDGVHQAIGSPKGQQPVAVLPIGYPTHWPRARPRRALAALVHEL